MKIDNDVREYKSQLLGYNDITISTVRCVRSRYDELFDGHPQNSNLIVVDLMDRVIYFCSIWIGTGLKLNYI